MHGSGPSSYLDCCCSELSHQLSNVTGCGGSHGSGATQLEPLGDVGEARGYGAEEELCSLKGLSLFGLKRDQQGGSGGTHPG